MRSPAVHAKMQPAWAGRLVRSQVWDDQLIDNPMDASDALSTVDTELLLIETAYTTLQRDHATVRDNV